MGRILDAASHLSRVLFLFLFLSIHLSNPCGAAASADAQVQGRRSDIVSTVESTSFSKPELLIIQKALGLFVGRPLDRGKIDSGIRELYAQGKIQSLFVESEQLKDSLKIIIRGSPLRRLRKIRFIDADPEVVEEIKAKVALEKGQPIEMKTLNQVRERLKGYYETRGYYFADVKFSFKDVPETQETDVDILVQQNKPTLVKRIVLIGAPKALVEDIRPIISLKKGKFFSKVLLEESVEKINRYFRANQYPTSKVEDTSLKFTRDRTEVEITFLLKLNDKFQFSFRGNTVFAASEFRDLLTEEILSQADANNRLVELIEAMYRKVGYHFCRVKAQVYRQPQEELSRVTFDIDEGEKVLIDEVTFGEKGGKSNSQWKRLFFENAPGVLKRGVYWEEGLPEAISHFEQQVESLGFLNASVPSPRAIFSRDRRGVRLFFDFEPGTRTIVARYEISGVQHFSREELIKLLSIPEGGPFNRQRLNDGKRSILEFYQSHGYLDAKVEEGEFDDSQYGKDDRRSTIHLKITEGSQYRIGKITVEGNRKTQEKVILREVVIQEGDIYDPKKVTSSEENLDLMGLFSKVEIVSTASKEDATRKDLKVVVKETMPGVGEIGLGLSYFDPFFFVRPFTGATYRNVMGLNNTASVRGEVSVPISSAISANASPSLIPFIQYAAITGYRAPMPFDLPVTFTSQIGFDGFEVALNGPTLQYRARVEAKVEHKFNAHFTGLYRIYHYERTTTDNLSDPSLLVRESIGSTGPGLVFDFRDDIFNPTRGSHHTLDFELASPILLSQDKMSFIMLVSRNSFYLPLFSPLSFTVALSGAYAKSLFEGQRLPTARLTNDLSLGGRGSLRGYAVGAFIAPYGTTELAYYNARFELTARLLQNIGVALFLDSGQLYPNGVPSNGTVDKRHDGVGVGLRYRTPVGPIVVDIAQGIEDYSGIKFYFTVGTL